MSRIELPIYFNSGIKLGDIHAHEAHRQRYHIDQSEPAADIESILAMYHKQLFINNEVSLPSRQLSLY